MKTFGASHILACALVVQCIAGALSELYFRNAKLEQIRTQSAAYRMHTAEVASQAAQLAELESSIEKGQLDLFRAIPRSHSEKKRVLPLSSSDLRKSPQTSLLLSKVTKIELRQQIAPLLHELGITGTDADKFLELLNAANMSNQDIHDLNTTGANADKIYALSTSDIYKQMEELLGEDKYSKAMAYLSSEKQRTGFLYFEQQLEGSGITFPGEKSEAELRQCWVEAALQPGGTPSQFVAQLAPHLTADQIIQLNYFVEDHPNLVIGTH